MIVSFFFRSSTHDEVTTEKATLKIKMSGFLNRLVRGRQKNPAPAESRQDNGLALSHLKRIFSEFRHPAPGATIQSQEEKLYSMIPLFNRVCITTQYTI